MQATTVKALPIYVFRTPALGGDCDCTNGGVSGRYDRLYLACAEGFLDIGVNNPQLVKLVVRKITGAPYKHIEPYQSCEQGNVGWMAGGNLGYCSDSRFPSQYPLAIHDRQETVSHYNALTR